MGKTIRQIAGILSGIVVVCLLLPARAYADIPNTLKTIKVYGELPYVVNALERLALVMSDANYQGLFFGIIVMMLVGGGLTLLAKSLTGGKISALIWAYLFGTLFCGIIVYHTFIRNTTTVLVTDETIGGKFKSVGGVPDGVAFLAGLMNKIESGIVEMIWMAGNVEGFREEAGGIGFDIINKAFSNGVDLSMVDPNQATGKYVNMSLRRYMEDCFLFEVGRPGSTINVNDININTDFVPILTSAASPAIFTVWYDAANPNGISLSCQQDWQNFLNPYLTGLTAASATVGTFWTHKCAQADLAQRNYAAYGGLPIETVCKDKITNLVSSLLGVAITSDQLMRQYLIASELDRVIQEGAPDEVVKTVGSYRKGVDMIGAGIMLNEWLPIIKGGYYAIFLGLMPFLFLLIPTPLFSRALTFILGSFFFLGSWGICDAIVHSTAMDYAANTFREITEGQLGLKSMLLFENESYKAMAAFGASRLMALSMAGAMCAMLMKFGGSAFAHMIHRSSIAAGSHGRVAAELTSQGEPTRRAAYQRGISEAYPTQTWANDYGYRDRVTAASYRLTSGTEASLQTVKRLGGRADGVAGAKTAAVRTGGAAGMQAVDKVIRKDEIQAIAHRADLTEDHVQHVTGAGKLYNETSKMAIRKALDEIATTGHMSSESGRVLGSIAQDPVGGAMLASQGIGQRIIKPGDEANNLSEWLAGHGKHVAPEKLAGATAQMNVWTDKSGKLHPSLLVTKEGVALANVNYESLKEGEFVEEGYRRQVYNEDSYRGVYVDADGIARYANFVFAKDRMGHRYVLSGSTDRTIKETQEGFFLGPDGKGSTGLRTRTRAPGTAEQEGTVLDSTFLSRDSVFWDRSKRFAGGYFYDNYVSALLEEHDHDRIAQGAGKVKGMFHDAIDYLGAGKTLFRPSRAKPHGGAK
jgi:hypothetical protein